MDINPHSDVHPLVPLWIHTEDGRKPCHTILKPMVETMVCRYLRWNHQKPGFLNGGAKRIFLVRLGACSPCSLHRDATSGLCYHACHRMYIGIHLITLKNDSWTCVHVGLGVEINFRCSGLSGEAARELWAPTLQPKSHNHCDFPKGTGRCLDFNQSPAFRAQHGPVFASKGFFPFGQTRLESAQVPGELASRSLAARGGGGGLPELLVWSFPLKSATQLLELSAHFLGEVWSILAVKKSSAASFLADQFRK